jgi:DNA/RNA-binding domain of Phe-tRNA-synthetase-like protein
MSNRIQPQCLQLTMTPDVVETFPGLHIGCILLEDIENYSSPEEQWAVTARIVSRVQQAFPSVDAVVDHYLQAHYAAFYRQMGLKPKKMSTPITQVNTC